MGQDVLVTWQHHNLVEPLPWAEIEDSIDHFDTLSSIEVGL